MDLFVSHGAIKSTLSPLVEKIVLLTKFEILQTNILGRKLKKLKDPATFNFDSMVFITFFLIPVLGKKVDLFVSQGQ